MSDPVLYFDPTSEPCRAVYWLAVDGGFAVQLRPTWLSRGEQKSAEVTAVNPEQQLPALWHDGFALAEATAIMHYLADRAGRLDDWFGAWPQARARVHQLLSWYHTHLRRRVTEAYFAPVLFRPAATGEAPPAADEVAARRQAAGAILDRIEQWLAQRPYLMGDSVTAADLVFAAELATLDIDPERAAFFAHRPATQRWLEAMRARDGYDVSHRAWNAVVPHLRAGAGYSAEGRDGAWIADCCEPALV